MQRDQRCSDLMNVKNAVSLSAIINHVDGRNTMIWKWIGLNIWVQVSKVYFLISDQILDYFL